jgi:thiol-disulfide isomerase/thioredoxin
MINGAKFILLMGCLCSSGCNPFSDRHVVGEKVVNVTEGLSLQASALVGSDDVSQDYWSGHWRIINIWAEWCKPCWQEIPELNQFFVAQEKFGVKLLGFNFDELERAELVILKERMSIQFPVLTQWPESWVKPEIKGLPATVILSPDNKIINILWGPQSFSTLSSSLDDAKKVIKDRFDED